MSNRRKTVRPRDEDGDRVEWDIPVTVMLPSDSLSDAEILRRAAPVKAYIDPQYITHKEWRG